MILELWRIENYLDFLAELRRLLAAETNRRMEELLHGDTCWFESAAKPEPAPMTVPGGITSDDEEAELEVLNEWVESQGLPRGQMSFDYTDPDTGEQLAVFDLAWPDGVQAELSQPVAVLLDEGGETLAVAAKAVTCPNSCTTNHETLIALGAEEVRMASGAGGR